MWRTGSPQASIFGHIWRRKRLVSYLGEKNEFLVGLSSRLSSGYFNCEDHFAIVAWDSRSTSCDHFPYKIISTAAPYRVQFLKWPISSIDSTFVLITPFSSRWSMGRWKFCGLPRGTTSSSAANNRSVWRIRRVWSAARWASVPLWSCARLVTRCHCISTLSTPGGIRYLVQ